MFDFFAFFEKVIKKLLTFCYWQDRKVYFDIGWCPSGSVQSETIANSTCTDRTGLIQYWGEKEHYFRRIPDADTSTNYLVGMIYSNLFQTLYYAGRSGRRRKLFRFLVHCIMDEWPKRSLAFRGNSAYHVIVYVHHAGKHILFCSKQGFKAFLQPLLHIFILHGFAEP